jgi:hypothetical protein
MNTYERFIDWLEEKPYREGLFYLGMILIAVSMWI